MNLKIIYLDNHLLTLTKPAGMLSQADETGDLDLLTLAKKYIKDRFQKPGNVYLGLVHRLDRPVSGLMVFARTSKAAARLSGQFRTRTVTKKYLALIEGNLSGEADWRDHLAKIERRVQIVKPGHPMGKPAHLTWRALGSKQGVSLISVRLYSGRPHQIRLQFASRGYPLLGDFRYKANRPFDGSNLALHAYCLALDHPVTKDRLVWTVAAPVSWSSWFPTERQALFRAVAGQVTGYGDRPGKGGRAAAIPYPPPLRPDRDR